MRPQSSRRSKVHRVRISRNTVIAEQSPSTQLKERRQPPPPHKIPLQPKWIESHPISRVGRLKNQVSWLRVHRILESSPQKSRTMLPRNHPPIAQAYIKYPGVRSPARHGMPTPSPHLYFMSILLRPRLRLPKPRPHHQDHKRENDRRGDEERRKKNSAPANGTHHGLRGCPTTTLFASHQRWAPHVSRSLRNVGFQGTHPLKGFDIRGP